MSADRGHCLLVEEPYTHVLSQKQRGVGCDWCFSRCSSLKKCAQCGFLQYCNRQCQKRDWAVHKSECPCLKDVSPKIPMDSARLMLRLVIRGNLRLPSNSMWSRAFKDLMTHKAEIKADTERVHVFAKMLMTLDEYAGTHVELPEAKDMMTMFCKMTINSFTICDGELQGIGTAIYLSGSKLDHSCRPNAVATFQGTNLVVRATEKIANPVPEKIFISYIEQLGTSFERKKQLEQQYYFTCTCDLCRDTQRDDLMSSVCCTTVNCDGSICFENDNGDVKPCSKCGEKSLTEDQKLKARDATTACREALKKIEEMKTSHDSKSRYDLCIKYVGDVKGVLNEMNVDYLRLLDQALDASIDSEQWDKAMEYGEQSLKPYRFYYSEYSPNVGIQLFKVGKIQLYLGKLEGALRTLQEAENILAVTHSKDHELYKDVRQYIDQSEEELRMKLQNSES